MRFGLVQHPANRRVVSDFWVILDTGVLIGALGNQRGNPASALVDVLASDRGLVSRALIGEYRSSLDGNSARRHHGLTQAAVSQFVDDYARIATLVEPVAGPPCPDPRDQHLWDLLAAGPDSILVTGEAALLESHHFPGRILSPRQFVERFAEASLVRRLRAGTPLLHRSLCFSRKSAHHAPNFESSTPPGFRIARMRSSSAFTAARSSSRLPLFL